MAYPPFYSSFPPPFYSPIPPPSPNPYRYVEALPTALPYFHHQPGIINFTHLCSPSPHLHYQDLIPSPNPVLSHCAAKNSSLKSNLTPPGFSHTSTPFPHISQISHHQQQIPNTLPWGSSNSFHQQPTLINFPNLSPHSHYIHSQDQILPLEPNLNIDLAPQYFQPTEKGEGEEEIGKSQEFIVDGSNFYTIVDDSFFVTANFSVPVTSEQSQEFIAEAKDKEDTPLQDPPSIFLSNAPISTPLFFTPTEKGEKEIAKSQDLIVDSPTVKISGSQLWFDFVLFAPDLVHLSCSANFVSQNVVFSSAKTLELAVTIFVFEKENTTVNTISATTREHSILVFDPGGCNVLNAKWSLGVSFQNLSSSLIFLLCKRNETLLNTRSRSVTEGSQASSRKISPSIFSSWLLAIAGTLPEKTVVNTIFVFDPGGYQVPAPPPRVAVVIPEVLCEASTPCVQPGIQPLDHQLGFPYGQWVC